jgi:hypothetical protein
LLGRSAAEAAVTVTSTAAVEKRKDLVIITPGKIAPAGENGRRQEERSDDVGVSATFQR